MAEYIDKSDTETVFREVRKRLFAKKKDYVAIEFLIRDQMLSAAEGIIHAMPAADVVERKRGEWEDVVSDDNEFLIHACSVCGHGYHMPFDFKGNIYFHNFCPNCGADMRDTPKEET